MNITCENCNSKLNVDISKIPAGKSASLKCPRCSHKILVKSPKAPSDRKNSPPSPPETASAAGDTYDAMPTMEDPADFDFYDGKTALVCENEPQMKTLIHNTLEAMEYRPHSCENTRDAIKKMRFQPYDIVILNELFDTHSSEPNSVLTYIEHLDASRRRDIFAVLISQQLQTMDSLTAYNKSVNIIVNAAHMNNLKTILEKGIERHEAFYRLFRESFKNRGMKH